MKRSRLKRISDTRKALLEERPKENPLHNFFLRIWDDREDDRGIVYCFETGIEMRRKMYRTNTACYSHILPKEMYPEYAYKEWNLKIVLPDSHMQYSIYPEKTPKQFAEYQKLLNLHKKGEL